MGIESFLKEIMPLEKRFLFRFVPENTNWTFLVEKRKIVRAKGVEGAEKIERKKIFFYYVVASNNISRKIVEKNCKTKEEVKNFIKKLLFGI